MADIKDKMMHSLNLAGYSEFPYTNCISVFESVLDYVFYDTDTLRMTSVNPLPPDEVVKANVALPSRVIPSDHLPIVFEFETIKKPSKPVNT